MPTKVIETYAAFMLDKNVNFNFRDLGTRHPDALIKLKTADGWVAWAYFLPEEPVLAHYFDEAQKRVTAFFSARQYTWMLDMLRNEGPCQFNYGEGRFEIWTTWEQAGVSDPD
jgi:hypothetical protein